MIMRGFSLEALRSLVFVAVIYAIAQLLGHVFTLFCEFLYESFHISIHALELCQRALNLCLYVILIIASYFYLRSRGLPKPVKFKSKESWKAFVIVPLIALLYRVFEDPLLRMELLCGDSESMMRHDNLYHWDDIIILFLEYSLLSSLLEELVFRRVVIGIFLKDFFISAIVISSLLFVLKHWVFAADDLDIAELITVFTFSIIASLLYVKGNLLLAIVFHSTYNLLWLILRVKHNFYSELIEYLDFNVTYWLAIVRLQRIRTQRF